MVEYFGPESPFTPELVHDFDETQFLDAKEQVAYLKEVALGQQAAALVIAKLKAETIAHQELRISELEYQTEHDPLTDLWNEARMIRNIE